MSVFDKLFGTNKKNAASNKPEKKPEYDFTTPGLSQRVTFGRNRDGEVSAVVLNKPDENLHKVIVNHNGCFENFPGIIRGEWVDSIVGKFDFDAGRIGFRTSFEVREEGGYRCLWEIQPDGRYWSDDGFGDDDDSEIVLYADLDENGDFITPFRIYSINAGRIDDPSVTDMEIDAKCTLRKYTGSDEVVVVPEGIKEIDSYAFSNNKTIKEIRITDSVNKIGFSTFYNCKNLESVTLPDNLAEIDIHTFGLCKSLKTIELPSKLRTVNQEAFYCSGIEKISLPEGMTSVGEKSFTNMEHLTTLHLPSTLKYIGENAFSYCKNLEEVNFPEGLMRIGNDAFDDCVRLEKVSLPDTLIELSPSAFSRTLFKNTVDFEALVKKINEPEGFPLPHGYKEMTFNMLKLQYSSEETDYDNMSGSGNQQLKKMNLKYVEEITDEIYIFENSDGVKAIMLYQSMPTFDSGDREWDSYRKFYLIPTAEGIVGFMECGGYKIAKIYYYPDIRWGNEKTKRLMEETNVF